MKGHRSRAIGALALSVAMGIGIPAAAYASSTTTTAAATPGAGFVAAQQKLEAELASRATRLQHLTADVSGTTSLSANVSSTLQARLSTESASINSLIAKVPTDTTMAELNADRAAMLKDNRVYAVMSPQIFLEIEASVVAEEVTTMQGNEVTLQTEVASLTGQVGYENALHHYNNYVSRISNWATKIISAADIVLAQTPQGFPGNTGIFVTANHEVLSANIAMAYASYDASVVGLAAGGYTGS